MFDLHKADEIYKKRLEENPDYAKELVAEWREDMPEQFAQKMYEDEYGCHIYTEQMYDEAVSYLKNPDETKGAHWDVNTIKSKAGIDFATKEYTLYDYCYQVNMHYSDYGDKISSDLLFFMAKRDLEDKDYYGDPTERAYKDARKRIRHHKK